MKKMEMKNMPVVTIEGPNIDKKTKKELIEKVSKNVADTYNLPIQAIVVNIHENNLDNVGVGGKQLSEKQGT